MGESLVPDRQRLAEEHVTIAYGRDFADVTPLRGVILGGSQHELAVAVDVDVVS